MISKAPWARESPTRKHPKVGGTPATLWADRRRAMFVWSLLLIGSTVILVACGIQSHEDISESHAEVEKGERMLCGTVGSITMKFPAEYTFLGVTYAGIDYWKPGYRDQTKWCGDQLLEATFSLAWPKLEAAGGRSWYTTQDPRYLTVSVSRNASHDPSQAMLRSLQTEAGDGLQPLIPRDIGEIDASKIRSPISGLFAIDADTFSPANHRRVFWEIAEDRSVSILIVCNVNTQSQTSRCSQRSFDASRDVWLTISYRIALLPKWREIQDESTRFISSVTIDHKDE